MRGLHGFDKLQIGDLHLRDMLVGEISDHIGRPRARTGGKDCKAGTQRQKLFLETKKLS